MIHLLLAIIYMAFISLGLPDGLLGSAWPSMYGEIGASVSWAGIIFMIISVGTVISSLNGDRLIRRFGAGKVTAVSVAMTALAMFGFSISGSFYLLCFWAVPYGLGAGSVDTCLNNYVAVHYDSCHMSWLHCMWGIGASVGPYLMGFFLSGGYGWEKGYGSVALIQVALTAVLFLSLPLWKGTGETGEQKDEGKALTLKEVIRIPGVKEIMVMFFCYCALEQTTGLWASSYLALYKGVDPKQAAFYGSLFFVGITAGRALNGFLAMKLHDDTLIPAGQAVVAVGIIVVLLPFGGLVTLAGFLLIGFGCAPIYPCVIHSTPEHFGKENSQAIIGVQMASAYVGNICMPPLFGMLAEHVGVSLLPVYLFFILLLMYVMHQRMLRKCKEISVK